jgi:hypothetical protein
MGFVPRTVEWSMDQGLVEQFTWIIINSEARMSSLAVNMLLGTLLYFVIGQAIAHPIFLKAPEEKRNSVRFRNRIGLAFGLLWPIVYPMYLFAANHVKKQTTSKTSTNHNTKPNEKND